MKKAVISILIIFLLCIFFGANIGKKGNKNNETKEVSNIEVKKEEVEWHGNYIWDGTAENNTWMCFRKKVNLKKRDIKNVIAQIAVDSKYWLYINGEMVVREGAVKRGETKNSIYYDNVDITKYLNEGKNTIAILTWYWGDTSYSHNSSGQGAMLFQAKIGNNYLVSNETWKVSRHKAYLQDELRPNKRLIEYNVVYDANLGDEEWYKPEYDDSEWANSTVLNIAGSLPWGDMIERDIPQFKDYGLKEYENMSDYENYVAAKSETIEMKIPYNAQFEPYLKIDSNDSGKKIVIKTDFYEDVSGDSVKCTYITKKGEQEFESLAWMNGENVYYEIPEGIKIISLGYRETGYDSEMTGKFESNDEFFNKLWKMADRTLYVNMRDSYMDCPNRERAQWFGDMSMEMMESMYALDTKSYALYEKGLKTTIGWKYDENILLTVVPDSDDILHLPTQMLSGINSVYEYYQYTGKKEILEYMYPHIKKYLNLWQVKEDTGLLECQIGYPNWKWGDSTENVDYEALENAWYYLALSKTEKIAELLNIQEDVDDYNKRLFDLKVAFNNLWTEKGYKTASCDYVDERVNAIAVISGLADEDKYEAISNVLTNSYECTVYMEKYILEALCKMGKINDAQDRIKLRYEKMVNGEKSCSTLWENWNVEVGTRNHAWSGGPLIIMSKYFAGIEPLEKGYDVVSIKPNYGQLSKISSKVTTIKGDIELDAEKDEYLKIKTPSKTRVAVPKNASKSIIKLNDKKVYENGTAKNNKITSYDSEDEMYIYFYVEAGEYEIKYE